VSGGGRWFFLSACCVGEGESGPRTGIFFIHYSAYSHNGMIEVVVAPYEARENICGGSEVRGSQKGVLMEKRTFLMECCQVLPSYRF
jgi:hypothetical protein